VEVTDIGRREGLAGRYCAAAAGLVMLVGCGDCYVRRSRLEKAYEKATLKRNPGAQWRRVDNDIFEKQASQSRPLIPILMPSPAPSIGPADD
jgi:hypothetical protein